MTERTIQLTYRVEELKQEIEKNVKKYEMALKEGGVTVNSLSCQAGIAFLDINEN